MKFESNVDLSKPTVDNAVLFSYNMFLKYLCAKGLNVLADSGIPKAFIHKSIRPGQVSIAHNEAQVPNEPVTVLDVNSAYPAAESQIAVPIGLPRIITASMSWDDVLSKPCFVVEANIIKYNCQHELDKPMLGVHVLNNIDFEYLPIIVDKNIKPRGYYWDVVARGGLKAFVDKMFEVKMRDRELGKAMLNKHIGMFAKRYPLTYNKFTSFKDFKSHPLIKDSTPMENGTMYRFYHEFDYTYNFSMVYSLILSQAKYNNEKLFRYCHSKKIPMYYSSCDSLVIPTRCLHLMKQFIDESAIGKLKIEAQGDDAIFISWGFYYINNDKWCAQSHTHESIIAYCAKQNMTVRDYFVKRLKSS